MESIISFVLIFVVDTFSEAPDKEGINGARIFEK